MPLADLAVEDGLLDGRGRCSRRRVLATAKRLLPTRRPICSWVRPNSWASCWVGGGHLQGIQVGPLDVLHQGQLEQLPGRHLAHHHRGPDEPGDLRRLPAALAGDEPVARAAPGGGGRDGGDHQRLQQAVLADRVRPAPPARPPPSGAAAGAGWARSAPAPPRGASRRGAAGGRPGPAGAARAPGRRGPPGRSRPVPLRGAADQGVEAPAEAPARAVAPARPPG